MRPTRNYSLLTDLYQLTMSYGYWKQGMADREAVFHLFFRKNPYKGNYAIAAGLAKAIELMKNFGFEEEDIEFLRGLKGNDGKNLFGEAFLQYLLEMKFCCEVMAVPEGSLVFPHEPILRIKGPIVQAQILETPLLNILNFQTLIATKSSRICQAAEGDTVLEFGLRRAQGPDGGLSASRAAYIGGCHATSNVLAGKLYDIPVKGTHAHSWVMSFPSERESFEAYAQAMPNNCVFLVDTFDTVEGVKKAIRVGKSLREKGYEMAGIRLDSGDLAELSIKSRQLLDEAGFPKAQIVASNDLDEYRIKELKEKGAKISIWGVGTRLATSYDQAALGGVYKLAAIRDQEGEWQYKIKLSEQAIKVSNPGMQRVMRHFLHGKMVGDVIYQEEWGWETRSFTSFEGNRISMDGMERKEVMEKIFDQGKQVYTVPSIHQSRGKALEQLSAFKDYIREDSTYPVGLSDDLASLKQKLMEAANTQKAI
ncbi:MAG: nicotinate phosphoribosyltransferase [Bacteroidota bacterium]